MSVEVVFKVLLSKLLISRSNVSYSGLVVSMQMESEGAIFDSSAMAYFLAVVSFFGFH